MGACKNMWIDENEAIVEQFLNEEITTVEFTDFMKGRGFDQGEISDMIVETKELR